MEENKQYVPYFVVFLSVIFFFSFASSFNLDIRFFFRLWVSLAFLSTKSPKDPFY